MMRLVALFALSLTACGTSDDAPSSADKKAACGEARDCTPDDEGCSQFPYEQLPDRCFDICSRHDCCYRLENVWQRTVYDCARPIPDAAIDAP